MFQRLFGKKRVEEPENSAATDVKDKQLESTEKAARAKMTIEKNIMDMNKKFVFCKWSHGVELRFSVRSWQMTRRRRRP